jgi:serine/threonine protein kinase
MLQSGVILGGIRIDSLLGRGAMGEVYLGQQLSLKRPVAVKRIAEHLLGDADALGRFAREAQCVARIQSPHVVAVHDFLRVTDEQGNDHALLVMELVDGGASLRALMAKRGQAFDWRTATALILHAAEGLAAAAEHGVVHRDVKPDNLMVTRKGVAKLADFGLAKSVDSSAMTIEGTVMGTPLYLPPEACRGQPVDARGDLYSLGATWFHLLTGRPPFQAASTVALLRAHLDDAPPDVQMLVPTIPTAIAVLVQRLLAKNPADRLPSAQTLVDDLHALAAQGITFPRTVPEIFGVDAATTVTHVPGASDVPAMTHKNAAHIPDSAVATLPMSTTAATVLAKSEERTMPAAAARAVDGPAAISSSPVSVPSPATAAIITPVQTKKYLRPIGFAVAVMAVVIVLMIFLGKENARSRIEQALKVNDHGLALQQAMTNLNVHPTDADAVALVREVVQSEIHELIATGRVEDARKRLAHHRTTFTWLDASELDGDIAMASAIWLATHHQEKEAVIQFGKLRQNGANPAVIDRAMVDSLADGDRPAEAIGAAWRVAQTTTGALEPKVLYLLTYALTWEGPFSDSMVDLRKFLIARHPPIIDTVRPWLSDDSYEKRYNAFLLLKEAGRIDDPESIRFHYRAVLTLTSSYTASGDSVTWLQEESKKPQWAERKVAAKLPPITDVPPALKEWNEHADRLLALLASAFLPECESHALEWINDADESLRWNAYKVLLASKSSQRVNPAQFHARTLAIFNPLYESAPFTTALDYFSAKAGSAEAPSAKTALEAGVAHITEQIAVYEKAGGNFMQMRANTCKERLKQVQKALAKF